MADTSRPWTLVHSGVVVNEVALRLPPSPVINALLPNGYAVLDGKVLHDDQWDGYPAERARLARWMGDRAGAGAAPCCSPATSTRRGRSRDPPIPTGGAATCGGRSRSVWRSRSPPPRRYRWPGPISRAWRVIDGTVRGAPGEVGRPHPAGLQRGRPHRRARGGRMVVRRRLPRRPRRHRQPRGRVPPGTARRGRPDGAPRHRPPTHPGRACRTSPPRPANRPGPAALAAPVSAGSGDGRHGQRREVRR